MRGRGTPVTAKGALTAKGFRPFFLLAASFAVCILPLWVATLLGWFRPQSPLDVIAWHAHEMVFGYSMAVIAGFLLTAVGNWTQRETLVGFPLFVLALVWVAGRLAMTFAAYLSPSFVALLDLAFLPLLMVAIGRPLLLAKNWRNLVMLAVLGALFCANLVVHLGAAGKFDGGSRLGNLVGLDIIVFVILLMAGRVFPMFTRNATGEASIRSSPWLDRLTLVGMVVLIVVDAKGGGSAFAAVVAGVVGIFAAARSIRWGARHSLRSPLLWILHLGYLWIPIGLFLRMISHWIPRLPASSSTHALTVGALGMLTLGMMARVSLGHSGRLLVAPRAVVASFVLIALAAITRVCAPAFGDSGYRPMLFVAAALWTAAFALYLWTYAPILWSPRVDGKPG